jgi:hypothetical protein
VRPRNLGLGLGLLAVAWADRARAEEPSTTGAGPRAVVAPAAHLGVQRGKLIDIPHDAIEVGGGAIVVFRRPRALGFALGALFHLTAGGTEFGLTTRELGFDIQPELRFPYGHLAVSVGTGLFWVNRITRSDYMLAPLLSVGMQAGPQLPLGDAGKLSLDATVEATYSDANMTSFGVRLGYTLK